MLNPDVGAVNVHVSKGSTRYDAIQVELRRRMSRGLATTVTYSYVKAWTSRLDSLRVDRVLAPAIIAVPHSLKFTATYDVPFGRGRRFAGDAGPWLEGIAGGWSVNMTGKVTSGRILSFGNVRLEGMTIDELQRSISTGSCRPAYADGSDARARLQPAAGHHRQHGEGVQRERAGYTAGAPTGRYFAPANGPDCIQVIRGDCAPPDVQAVAPPFSRFDFGARKRIGLGKRMNFILEVDVLNLFNAINFNPVALPGNPANRDGYQVTSSYEDVNNLADPGSRVGQIVLRFNW